MLYDLIIKAQNRNDSAMLELVGRFTPLLRKYARKLNYEDAYDDLQMLFIELIQNIDLVHMRSTVDAALVTYS